MSREERNFHIDPSRTLQINLDQVRPAGSENPENATPVSGVAHLLRHHRIYSTGHPGIPGTRIPTSQSLVSLVDEDNTPPQGMEQTENFLEIPFRAPYPSITKILHFHDGHSRFASETFDEVGLSSSHRSTKQVTHRHRPQVVLLP